MTKIIFMFLIFNLFFSFCLAKDLKEITVIGTLHGDHGRLPLYNFETLGIILRHINPDVVFIEEDPETFKQGLYKKLDDDAYMNIRPIEIKKVVIPLAEKMNWKIIPIDSRIIYDQQVDKISKKLDENIKSNSQIKKKWKNLNHAYESWFTDDYLTRTFNDFHSTLIMSIIEQRNNQGLLDPDFKEYFKLSELRQNIINKNLENEINRTNFKKAVVVFGLSHRPALIRFLKKMKNISLIEPDQAVKPIIPGLYDRTTSDFAK